MTVRLPPPPHRGAALLVAMIILTLVATLAGGMLWQQSRAVQVEAAERARTQAQWILNGALDWARVILREDKDGNTDNLGEPWAVPLAEARLSSFLAADRDNVANDNQGLDAFLSGSITDLQAHYNVRNLIKPGGPAQQQGGTTGPSGPSPDPDQMAVLTRLCTLANVQTSVAQRIADGFLAIAEGRQDAPLVPQTVAQLAWFGIDPKDLKRLEPFITVLPQPTPVNANTAPPEVLAAILPGGLAEAQRWVQMRQSNPFGKTKNPLPPHTPPLPALPGGAGGPIDVITAFFEVRGQVRLGDRALQERSVVQRQGGRAVNVLYRERVNLVSGPG
jgi:general secretion pathway protein K